MVASPELIQHWLEQMAVQDDKRAFRYFFDHFYTDAYRVAFFHLQDRETAEELTSDVFLKFWERRRLLPGIQFVRTYLLVSVKNHCLNHLRQQNRSLLSLDEELPVPNHDADPEQTLVWTEMQQSLHRAVATLPPRCGLIFQMVRDQQLSYRDVADALAISPKTVEIQMGIALKRLGALASQAIDPRNVSTTLILLVYFFAKSDGLL